MLAHQSGGAAQARAQHGAAGPCTKPAPSLAATVALAALLFYWLPTSAQQIVGNGQARDAESIGLCQRAARETWPEDSVARRARLSSLEAQLSQCSADPDFLASLGALWLEEGEPAKALLWLERSLLLNPDALGARADYALALAELGEPAAREQLAREWRGRSDVPPHLTKRLQVGQPTAPRPAVVPGRPANEPRWYWRRETAIKFGNESNLDHSPVLDGLTLTSPDGIIDLPLAVPIRPRKGQAVQSELSVRSAYDSGNGSLWQASMALVARHSPSQPATDWQYLQAAGDYWADHGNWRYNLQVSAGIATGQLTEPYGAVRLGAALERDAGSCTQRGTLEIEARRQRTSHNLDGNLASLVGGGQCRFWADSDWKLGLEARVSVDHPVHAGRPGDGQLQAAATVRANGKLGKLKIDSSWRYLRSRDGEGYSPLLENNARRTFGQWQWQVELTYPIEVWPGFNLDALLQWDVTRQRSNLVVFEYRANSIYGGLRWRW